MSNTIGMSTFRCLKRYLISLTATGIAFFMVILTGPASASESENIESAMSAEERLKSGVDTLTAEQRQFLNEWLKEHYGRRSESDVTRITADDRSNCQNSQRNWRQRPKLSRPRSIVAWPPSWRTNARVKIQNSLNRLLRRD